MTLNEESLKLKVKLYQHQLKALQFHIDRDKSADWSECGTGKSITALAKFVFLRLKYPDIKCLVLCPASLVLNWLREIQKVSNFKALAVIGTVNQKLSVLDQDADIYICSYDSLRGKQTLLFCRLKQMVDEYEWFIICDEINHIQNIHALRTMFTYWLLRKAKRLIMLSGTPITNDPYKVMNIYRLLNGAFTRKDRFKFFVNVGKYYPKWVLRKETLPEFHRKFYYNAIRFKKEECFDLPEKVFINRMVWQTHEQEKEIEKIIANDSSSFLETLVKIQQILSGFRYEENKAILLSYNPKREMLKTLIQEIGNKKVVIFCNFLFEVEIIKSVLSEGSYVVFIGSMSAQEKEKSINNFNELQNVLYFISTISCSYAGLNLQKANYMIYFNLPLNLTHYLQSQDRIHRIGQNKKCFYFQILTNNKIEKRILYLLEQKMNIIELVVNPLTKDRIKNFIINGKGFT